MATHTGISHLYAVTRYRGAPASQWQNETAQWGIRLGVTFGDTKPPLSQGDWTMPGGVVVDSGFTQTLTNERRDFGFSNDGSSDAYSLAFQGAVIDLLLAQATGLRAFLGASYELDSVRLYAIKNDGTSPTEPTVVTPLTNVYDPIVSPQTTLAPQNAMVVSFNSAVRSRKGRGRVYLGPLKSQANNSTTGLLDPDYRAAGIASFVTLFDGLRGISEDAGTAVAIPIIWHKPGSVGAVINAIRADDQLDVQRRREGQRTPVWVETPLA